VIELNQIATFTKDCGMPEPTRGDQGYERSTMGHVAI